MNEMPSKSQTDIQTLRSNISQLGAAEMDLIFRQARTFNAWQDRAVSADQIKQLYDLLKWGPTSVNCQPARFVFLQSDAAKERLRPALAPTNVDKTMAAPVVAIIGYDNGFVDNLLELFPHYDFTGMFRGNDAFIESTAFRNSSLQGAYFMIAARALGLDTGAMSGFDNAKVDAEFFADTQIKSNFICNLGYGDENSVFPRSPRMPFDDACQIL